MQFGEGSSAQVDVVKMGRTQLQDAVPMPLGRLVDAVGGSPIPKRRPGMVFEIRWFTRVDFNYQPTSRKTGE